MIWKFVYTQPVWTKICSVCWELCLVVVLSITNGFIKLFLAWDYHMVTGDLLDEEKLLVWLTSQNVFELKNEILGVNSYMLEKLLSENEFLAVYFCKCQCGNGKNSFIYVNLCQIRYHIRIKPPCIKCLNALIVWWIFTDTYYHPLPWRHVINLKHSLFHSFLVNCVLRMKKLWILLFHLSYLYIWNLLYNCEASLPIKF